MNNCQRIQITKERAAKLVKAWKGHNDAEQPASLCFSKSACCPINKLFMEWEKKINPEPEKEAK